MRTPWWTSYRSLRPRRIAMVASTDGSPTLTGWKRRSSAGSFSMCLRYSSSVVAPTARSSPRASIGLSMLPASTAPSAPPAPTMVWSSSMKTTICPAESAISLRTALSRSSNSPRYFAPATIAEMSRAISRRSRRDSGTSPSTMRWARPSAIAVLPTPGSPMSTGLFFVRRERTWMTRRISSSRPMTGSSLPSPAAAVRSRPNFSSAWTLSSGLWSVTWCGPRTSAAALASASWEPPWSRRICPARPPWPASESRRCSTDTYSSPSSRISCSAARRTCTSSSEAPTGSLESEDSAGSASRAAFSSLRRRSTGTPSLRRIGGTRPPSCSRRTSSRCSGAICGLRPSSARRCAAWTASWDLVVNLSKRMVQISVVLTKILARQEGDGRRRGPGSGRPRAAARRPLAERAQRAPGDEVAALHVGHDLGPELAADRLELLDLGLQLLRPALERGDLPLGALELLLELEDALDAREVHAELRELLDPPQALHVAVGVEPRALRRALGLDEPALLVHPQRLGVHLRQLRGHGDHEHAPVARDLDPRGGPDAAGVGGHHTKSLSRGLVGDIASASSSTFAFAWAERVAGTSMTKR